MDVLAVVVVGDRVGDPADPGVLALLGGVPVVGRSVRAMLGAPGVEHVHLLVPARHRARVLAACSGMPVTAHCSAADLWAHARQRSGFTDGDDSFTDRACGLVHDAARPLVPPALTHAVVTALDAGHRAVVPVLPLADTVKVVGADGLVHRTPDRAALRVVQTPQGFRGDLRPVLAAAAHEPAQAWAAAGGTVHTVPGHPLAFPVHRTWDLELAESTVGERG